MNNSLMKKTMLYGLACCLAFAPTGMILGTFASWPLAFRMIIWTDLSLYLFLAGGWSGKGGRKALPASLLLFFLAASLPSMPFGSNAVFMLSALFLFAWVRSGILFEPGMGRGVTAELVLCLGGGILTAALIPNFPNPPFHGQAIVAWALGLLLFFLVQSLYFLFCREWAKTPVSEFKGDGFDRAKREAEKILAGEI